MPIVDIRLIADEDFGGKTLSHTINVVPTTYRGCTFQNANMSSVVFENSRFIDCVFDDCDASNSTFQNCQFIDCSFRLASFAYSVFIGCEIRQKILRDDSPFDNAGFGNTTFTGGEDQSSIIENVHFLNCSFRNSIFERTNFLNVTFEGVPFEKVVFQKCEIDFLSLKFGTVKGLRFLDCQVSKIETTTEKVFSIIGLYEVLFNSDFKIFAETSDDKLLALDNLSEVGKVLVSGLNRLADAGAFYEFLNVICFLSRLIRDKQIETKLPAPIEAAPDTLRLSGDFIRDIEIAVDWYVQKNGSTQKSVSLNSINYAMDVLISYNVITTKIYLRLLEMSQAANALHKHPQVAAEIFWKFKAIEQFSVSTHFTLVVTDHSVENMNYESSAKMTDCIAELLRTAEITDYRIVSRTEGSIVEKILIQKLDLVTKFWQLATILVLLDFSATIDLPQYGVRFSYNEPDSSIKSSIEDELKFTDDNRKTIIELCNHLDFVSEIPPENLDKIVLACSKSREKLYPLKGGMTDFSISPSTVGDTQFIADNVNFLLPQSRRLEHKDRLLSSK